MFSSRERGGVGGEREGKEWLTEGEEKIWWWRRGRTCEREQWWGWEDLPGGLQEQEQELPVLGSLPE